LAEFLKVIRLHYRFTSYYAMQSQYTTTSTMFTAASPATLAPASSKTLTVYFDGACPVCSKEIAYYQQQAGAQACAWVDASTCDEPALGPGLTRAAALGRFHVRHADGSLTSGMGGFAALWRVLPKTAWLGRVASFGPVPFFLDQAYRVFLALRPLWRPAAKLLPWPQAMVKELRSDHAGEVGAVQIYRGMLAVSRNPELRAFAQHHLATEQTHLLTIESHLPAAHHSRLLFAWRVAGWLTGALPAVLGPRFAHATVAAVESFVNQHYAEQIQLIDQVLQPAASPTSIDGAERARWLALRDDLERCRLDELQHREDALSAGVAQGFFVNAWTRLIARGSAGAVALARRL
jgi:3-demethoxyubiquinol 3-hydroxylase